MSKIKDLFTSQDYYQVQVSGKNVGYIFWTSPQGDVKGMTPEALEKAGRGKNHDEVALHLHLPMNWIKNELRGRVNNKKRVVVFHYSLAEANTQRLINALNQLIQKGLINPKTH